MKIEVGKKYTDGCLILEVKFFDHEGTAWCLTDKKWSHYILKQQFFRWTEVTDKPDPGEGWRLLHPDEDLEGGDEIFLPDAHPFDDWNCVEAGNNRQTPGMHYRRRIAPQYVPYTWDDREELRERWFKQKGDVLYERKVYNIAVERSELFIDGWEAKEFLQKCEWLDGTPCGKKVV
jgi:hypothetical protein